MSNPEFANIGALDDRVIEECAELVMALSKARRFGWLNNHPSRPSSNNAAEVYAEIVDSEKVIKSLKIHLENLFGFTSDKPEEILKLQARIKELEISIQGVQRGGRNIQRAMGIKIDKLTRALAEVWEILGCIKKDLEEMSLSGVTESEKLKIKKMWNYVTEALNDPCGSRASEDVKTVRASFSEIKRLMEMLIDRDVLPCDAFKTKYPDYESIVINPRHNYSGVTQIAEKSLRIINSFEFMPARQ